MSTTPTAEFPQVVRIDYNTDNNTWGGILNVNFDVLARALGGWEQVAVGGGGDVSLTETQFSTRFLALTGVLTANINLIVPAQERSFVIQNSATGNFTVTVKTASGTGIAMPAGVGAIWPFQCDGAAVQIGLKIIDCSVMGQIRNFQSLGINDAATSTVMTITSGGRIDLAAGTIFTVNDGVLGAKYNSSADIDHIWHDDASNTWRFVSGGSARTTDITNLSNLEFHNLHLLNGGVLTVPGAVTFSSTLTVNGAGTFDSVTTANDLVIGGVLTGGGLGSAAYEDANEFSLTTHSHSGATPSAAGYMSAADKQKLDALPTTVGFSNALLHVIDQKPAGTEGGTFLNTGGGVERELTSVLTNEIAGASVASNTIILPVGTYWVEAQAPAFGVDRHRATLFNDTLNTTLVRGSNEFAGSTNVQTSSTISGRFTLSAGATLKIIHECQTTKTTDGRGRAMSFGSNPEVYTVVSIWKI